MLLIFPSWLPGGIGDGRVFGCRTGIGVLHADRIGELGRRHEEPGFVATPECIGHWAYKEKIVQSGDTDTTISKGIQWETFAHI